MICVGLTGSIGMGKSTALNMFAELGAATWSADEAVHRLYGEGGAAVPSVAEMFPDAVIKGVVDRSVLARLVLSDPEKLKNLEAIVHPLVAQDRKMFLEDAIQSGVNVSVLDIPLLFESGAEGEFDTIVVVSAPENIQRARVLDRPGMTKEKFAAILQQQMPDQEKRAKADYVISTAGMLEETRKQVQTIYQDIIAQFAH